MWKKIVIDDEITNYSVSDIGEVKNDLNGRFLKQATQQGYKHVTLSLNKKSRRFRVHRLVAQFFIPNPDNKPYVNHLDGNRSNNNVSNLEWVTPSENTRHAVETGLMLPTRERKVIQYDMDGKFIKEYKSISAAARETNSLPEKIIGCCRMERKTHNNFQWRYEEDRADSIQRVEIRKTAPKKVAQIDPETNKIVAIYDSYCQAAKAVNGTQSAITHVIKRDKGTKTHKGYKWELVDEIVQ